MKCDYVSVNFYVKICIFYNLYCLNSLLQYSLPLLLRIVVFNSLNCCMFWFKHLENLFFSFSKMEEPELSVSGLRRNVVKKRRIKEKKI